MTPDEIAMVLEQPLATVKSNLHRGLGNVATQGRIDVEGVCA
jgi:DNA-directed RNA polymerase specialized sigma24 family protein